MDHPEIKVLADPNDVAAEAVMRIVLAANQALSTRETFSLVLAGGSTPKLAYQFLASEELQTRIDWPRVQIYFGDERCVPPDHAESNYRMAREALLSKVRIPGDNIYRMRGEIDPNAAAIEYGRLLKDTFGEGGPDLVLLGMGDDGHTASLFPGTTALMETKHRCVAHFVENSTTGKSWRITMTAPFINRAAEVMVLVCGAGKAARLTEVLEGPREPLRLPIQLIQPNSGRMSWLIDTAAAGM